MRAGVVLLAGLACFLAIPSAAVACRMPTPPHDPTHIPAEAVVEGVVGAISLTDYGMNQAEVAVEKVWLGRPDIRTTRVSWRSSKQPGLCNPPGPIPNKGDRLMLYLNTYGGSLEPIGWSYIAGQPDASKIKADNDAAIEWRKDWIAKHPAPVAKRIGGY